MAAAVDEKSAEAEAAPVVEVQDLAISFQQVAPRLFFGSRASARRLENLQRFKIGAVVEVLEGPLQPHAANGIEYYWAHIDDVRDPDMFTAALPGACDFIQSRRERGINVLVHCFAGQSRSGAVVLGTLMSEGMTLADAWKQVAAARPRLFPSPPYFKALCAMDVAAHGTRSMTDEEYLAAEKGTSVSSVTVVLPAGAPASSMRPKPAASEAKAKVEPFSYYATYQQVAPHLHFGGLGSAKNRSQLEQDNIKAVVCCLEELLNPFPDVVEYYHAYMPDLNAAHVLRDALPGALKFIRMKRSAGINVLVHCQHGMSRSGSIVLATLVDEGLTLATAWDRVAAARPVLAPEPAYFEALCNFEEAAHGHRSLTRKEYRRRVAAVLNYVSGSKQP